MKTLQERIDEAAPGAMVKCTKEELDQHLAETGDVFLPLESNKHHVSTKAVQAYKKRQLEINRRQRTLYATDWEFKRVKALLREMRK